MRLEDFDSGERYQARVLVNSAVTASEAAEEIRELVLEVDRHDFSYAIGQSVGVIVSGPFQQAGHADMQLAHSHHYRLYTVADTPNLKHNGLPEIKLCVKRCNYIDEYSGERYAGIASNYLCDLGPNDRVTINGPFGLPFKVPEDRGADLLLIGMGTGIAPFRAFVKHLYRDVGDWRGRVRLFSGARSGLEMPYMNEECDDFAQHYDEDTFEAIRALSPRPHRDDPVALDAALEQRAEEVLSIITSENGHIYVAGRADILATLERVFSGLVGSDVAWAELKSTLKQSGRWQELVY